jgi:inosine/xanthosine triphosphate pyrophosphatase family protein
MDPSHSLFIFNARFNPKDHYAQLELDERATFSRSRRAIEKFNEELHSQTDIAVSPKAS